MRKVNKSQQNAPDYPAPSLVLSLSLLYVLVRAFCRPKPDVLIINHTKTQKTGKENGPQHLSLLQFFFYFLLFPCKFSSFPEIKIICAPDGLLSTSLNNLYFYNFF